MIPALTVPTARPRKMSRLLISGAQEAFLEPWVQEGFLEQERSGPEGK